MEALKFLEAMREQTIALLYYATRTGKIVTAAMDTKNCGDRTLFLTHTQEPGQPGGYLPQAVAQRDGRPLYGGDS